MKRQKNQKKSKIAPILGFSLITVATACVAFSLLIFLNQPKDTTNTESKVDYNPPTQEEIDAGQKIKEDNAEKNGQTTIADYSIFIVDAAQYGQDVEVRSYVEGIIKDSGTCTFTFTKGSSSVMKSSDSSANAAHTDCKKVVIPTSEFPSSGTWSLLISYDSNGITASSSAKDVEITK